MEEGRGFRGTRNRNPFDVFGTFGGSTHSIFGRNPFDDPFFSRPNGGEATLVDEPPPRPPSKGPVIHQLDSDDEREGEPEIEADSDENLSKLNQEPFVDHPDEDPKTKTGKNEIVADREDLNKAEGKSGRSFQFHSTCKVTYGGVDGAYYSSTSTRRMGDDGVLMEECKEADKRTGEANHRVSRSIHDKCLMKGHSLTRKLNSDGKVETLQTLHNLNEDELETFENSWKGNTGRHIPLSTAHTGSSMSDWAGLLPSSQRAWGTRLGNEAANSSSRAQPKKVVRINIE